MTPSLRYRWYDFASKRPEDEPDLLKIANFLAKEAELCSRYAPAENVRDRSPSYQKRLQKAYATTSSESKTHSSPKKATSPSDIICPMCEGEHKLINCKCFKDLTISDRWERAKEYNICFRCLNKRSFRHKCNYKPCGIEDCKSSHHPLLHSPKENADEKVSSDMAVVTSARPRTLDGAFLKVLPVRITGPTGAIDTYALLDEGSTITLIEDKVAQKVGATGPKEPFDIEGVGGARISADSSRRVSLKIMGRHEQEYHEFTARTIDHLHLSPQTIDKTYIDKFDHLREIAHDLVYHRGTPTLLIGRDNWHLIVSRSIKSGERGQPATSFTELGWVLHGPSGDKSHRIHFVSKITVHSDEDEERIDNMIKSFFDLDAIGIEPKLPKNDPNERALRILEERSRRLPDGRFETGLLWRNDNVVLPNNKDMAMKRLEHIERKLDRNPDLKQQYNEQMLHLIDSGYVEIAPSPPCPGRTWYLPHLAVLNPSKPKPRIVLDAGGLMVFV